MASHEQQPASTGAQIQQQTDELPSSTPVELSHLERPQAQQDEPVSPLSPGAESFTTPPTSARQSAYTGAMPGISALREEEQSVPGAEQALPQIVTQPPEPTSQPASTDAEKQDHSVSPIQPTSPAPIGPATSQQHLPTVLAKQEPAEPAEPSLQLIILLTTGARHPFTISRSYLQKRDVKTSKVGGLDPYGISGYTLKELIWRDWRSEWEGRPSSPGGIRLISFGKLIEDSKPLSGEYKYCKRLSRTHWTLQAITLKQCPARDREVSM